MPVVQFQRATLDDLHRYPEKAELVGGRIVPVMPTGRLPNRIAARIFRSLDDHAKQLGIGEAYTDNMGFTVPELPSGRESFSPDASYFGGPFSGDPMEFIHGPPTFAVEVRSDNDYGATAEAEMEAKRTDYFAAGTVCVWDVDPAKKCVRVYEPSAPKRPRICRQGDSVDAGPALPGWMMSIDSLFA